jgi:apolipoprotein N-acyltransferase
LIHFGKIDFVAGASRYKITPLWKQLLINSVISIGAGLLYALALAPCNFEILAFISLVPLLAVILKCRPAFALLYGWLWGIGWGFCSYNFLREIEPVVPYLMAPVIAIWPAVWSVSVNLLCRHTLIPAKFPVRA